MRGTQARAGGSTSEHRARFAWVFALVCAMVAALPLAHRFLPLVDWPQHLAQDTIVAHQRDPSFNTAEFYRTTGWFLPYQGFRQLHVLVSRALHGDDWLGGRVTLSLTLLATTLALLAITRALGRSPWLALVAVPLVVDANVLWGFAPYALATTLQLWQLALVLGWLNHQQNHRPFWRLALVSLLGVAMFFTHAQPVLLSSASIAALALHSLRKRVITRRELARLALAMIPAALLLGLYLTVGGWLSGEALADEFRVERKTVWHTPWAALYWIKLSSGLDAMGQWPAIAFGLGLWAAWRASRASAVDPVTCNQEQLQIDRQNDDRARLIAAVFFVAYFLLPNEFRGQSLAPRVASLALVSLTWAVGWRGGPAADAHPAWARRWAQAKVLAAVCALGALGWTHWVWARFDREMRVVDRAIAALPSGQRVAVLAYQTHAEGLRLPVLLHTGAYALVARGGLSSMGFTRTGITYRSEVPRDALTVLELWAPSTAGWQLDPARHGDYYDFVFVVRGPRYSGHPFRGGTASGVRAARVFAEERVELWRVER